jgi:predicted transcriptional regulator
MYAILKLCSTGSRKTHIMYRANLSHYQLEMYLFLLIEKNLLALKQRHYTTTPKGYLFIKSFEELVSLINAEEATH